MQQKKKAIQYIRISDKDQSHFSLDGQQETNMRYADRMGIEIIRTYIDNGESARDFDRPNWKLLIKDLEVNKKSIDYLIVMKYDRLIRNTAHGLLALEKIEIRWNVKVLSSTEQISIDPDSPFFFKFRADILVNAEFERLVISDRTKFGTWRAKSEGRYIGRAPLGYRNATDQLGKPILQLGDQSEINLVQTIFRMFLADKTIGEIKDTIKAHGFTYKGNSTIQKILNNPVYAGLIKVPRYKGEEEMIVKGKHAAIISESDFRKVKVKFGEGNRKYTHFNPEVFLKGVVHCENCGARHTASRVKGKLKYYWYYNCNTCKWINVNASKSHELLQGILNQASLSTVELDYIKSSVEGKISKYLHSFKSKKTELLKQKEQLASKLESLEEKYIMNEVDSGMYQKWSYKIAAELDQIENSLQVIANGTSKYWSMFNSLIDKLSNIGTIFEMATTKQKQELIQHIFLGKLVLSKTGYRTPDVNPILFDKLQDINGLDIIKKGDISTDNALTPLCSP